MTKYITSKTAQRIILMGGEVSTLCGCRYRIKGGWACYSRNGVDWHRSIKPELQSGKYVVTKRPGEAK